MKETIYNNIKDLSASSLHELENCIEALYEMLPLDKDDCDEVWLHNRLRHILECVLTDEAFSRLYDEYHDLKLLHNCQEKLLKEVDVLLRTFWNLVSSSEKYIIFKDFYCNHSFLSSAESLHTRIKRELATPFYRCREKKKGGV